MQLIIRDLIYRSPLKELEKKMKEDFKKRTGQDATYFEVW